MIIFAAVVQAICLGLSAMFLVAFIAAENAKDSVNAHRCIQASALFAIAAGVWR